MKIQGKKEVPILILAGLCIAAVPFIIISALSIDSGEAEGEVIETHSYDFDYKGDTLFKSLDGIASEYLKGSSTQRALRDYYSLRQYHGSPPYIPHRLESEKISDVNCISCHEKGGWSQELELNTPLTPHPEQVNCIQCHLKLSKETLFGEIEWVSNRPPVLGRSYLPGSPVPIPHDLQGRGNCIACHTGPGSIDAIRSDHPERGSCRQCHVPDLPMAAFKGSE